MPEGSVNPARFPFSGIYGNGSAKTAMLCAAVNPHIKAVLIKGASGTAKTVLARSICSIDGDKALVNVPLNVTDEQLFGAIDIEQAVSTGVVSMGDSLMKRADGNYLYLDDVDLFDPNTVTNLMDGVIDERIVVERENISASYRCDTTVIASMNSSRKYFDPHILDRFDICVTMRRPKDAEACEEIIRRNLSFTEGDFREEAEFIAQDKSLTEKIAKAKKLLPSVHIAQARIRDIARLCHKLGVKGCRGAISTVQTAIAIAALDGRKRVTPADTAEAALLCMDHRRTAKRVVEEKKKQYDPLSDGVNPIGGLKNFTHDDRGENESAKLVKDMNGNDVSVKSVESGEAFIQSNEKMADVVSKVGEQFETIDLLEAADSNGMRAGDEVAKRLYVESKDRNGKYIRARVPDSKNPDVAFDATVRAAAPYQSKRREPGREGIILKKQDLREKVREKQVSSTFMFLLDTSGSLIIRNRMSKVKAAIISMLETHYVKRDRVGLMTFNEDAIDVMLQPTRATEQLTAIIDKIAVGQGTPLGEAFMRAYNYMMPYTMKHPDERCHIVLITDGKATVSIDPNLDPVKEAIGIAAQINIPNTDWIVIDTGLGYTKNEIPGKLAEALHGKFFLLDDLQVKEETQNLWTWAHLD